ncbi:MAG TPA: DNA ligase D [Candidatus Polarisedimenticolaceae bacterium]|nr:DNA ligase D [Candidatus Polarisedimenticolaceae bacterium]
MARRRRPDPLSPYRDKRSAERTSEPFRASGTERPRLFVVQMHAARRLHYDLRLELGGVLHSWAVPKGPSLDPADKRLAVEVEDHPLDYADFEGLIPEGEYGAGAVIVWDRGRWLPVEDPDEGVRRGKLVFDLEGYKLRGRWDLFRTSKGKANEWLLVKKKDGWAGAGKQLPETSILSGLTVEQLREGDRRAQRLRSRLRAAGAKEGDVEVARVELMLAQPRAAAFDSPEWLFELKYDGYRLLAGKYGERAMLRYRRGRDVTGGFPEIVAALRRLPYDPLVLDGELVVLDAEGRPSFQRLQRRVQLSGSAEIARATVELPATLFAFDLLALEGFDLRPLPLVERKALLREVLPAAGPIRFSDHVKGQGKAMFAEVERRGLEGIVAKRIDSAYRGGRGGEWVKIRADRRGDFAIVGTSPPQGAREGFGALHVACREGGQLVYAGRVGSGFSAAQLRELTDTLATLRRSGPACAGPVPREAGQVWVEPELVCAVRYKEWTDEGLLRQPVFAGLRPETTPAECEEREPLREEEPPAPPPVPARPARRELSFTNLDKVFWPEQGITKGELIDYYRSIAPWLLPYLADRPVVLTRYPDGIAGKSFFQKDAPGYTPDWLRRERMWSEHAAREIHYFVCDDEASLLYLVNLGTIPLHIWSSRVASLQNPDWSILDLDPKQAPFRNVVRLARSIRTLCKSIDLDCFIKTSGATGLHVMIPLGRVCTYDQSRSLAEVLARVVVKQLPDIATLIRAPGARGGRIYIDTVQNGHGRLLVSPLSVRPLPGAPVSTPLRWEEVDDKLDPGQFTIRNVPGRLKRAKRDPLRPVLERVPDLPAVLERLAARL